MFHFDKKKVFITVQKKKKNVYEDSSVHVCVCVCVCVQYQYHDKRVSVEGVSFLALMAHLSFFASVRYKGLQCKCCVSTCKPFIGNLIINSSITLKGTDMT